MLAKSGDRKVTYEGGLRKCMVVKEGMGIEELIRMVREMIGSDMSEEKLWYSLKYDREMLVAVEGDSDVKAIFKGNDEHGYMYIARNGGPVRRAHERATVCEGRVPDSREGKQIARSGRNNNQAGERYDFDEDVGKLMAYLLVCSNCRSLGRKGGEPRRAGCD
ncbi:hypothetical protein Cgig2_005787 [Carnegiea gigantea]|uniref:Uncharacterized protein n=1 Tax=Carnegiea gigantea TaxID=171969 RepID=A0A9Q1JZR8_9CARY|nr:hypothetical protein Cgig2_005787 [Carnegiea gigantea]